MMTTNDWLTSSQDKLQASGIGTARLDALVLLEDCLGVNRATLLAHPELTLATRQEMELDKQIGRRATHEPLAYIRGKTEFYGRDFIIDHHVLEPRPESETIIELLRGLALPDKPQIVDVGTGSGMLAITVKLELPQAKVTAIDIDPDCLAVAAQNCQKYELNIALLESDLLEKYTEPADVLLCNLPYVPDDFQINQAALREPKIAIFGGPDGLDLYRKLFTQIDTKTHQPTYVLAESLPPQHEKLAEIAAEHSYKQITEDDFIQLFRLS
jgi:release factor glutamine methyltransferase